MEEPRECGNGLPMYPQSRSEYKGQIAEHDGIVMYKNQSIVFLTYRPYSQRHCRAPAKKMWSDFRDEIWVEYGPERKKAGSLPIASIDCKMLFSLLGFHGLNPNR